MLEKNATALTQIGTTEVHVTRLGFGAGVIGGLFSEVSEETAISTVRHALSLGINYIDTAPLYGHGKSETRLGLALENVARDTFILSTKVGRLLVPTPQQAESIWFKNLPALEPVFDFSYDAVRRSLDASLERLKLDRVDILYIHDPDGAFDEVMQGAYRALHELREQGVVRAIGIGCWDAALLARFAEAGDFDAFLLPGKYTLLDQSALDEMLPVCLRKNISVIVGTPYGSGILATGSRAGAKFNYEDADPQMLDRVQKMEAVCARYQVPLQAAALQFPFDHAAVASIIPGARSPQEVETGVRMFECPIPAEMWKEFKAENLIRSDAPTSTS
jgi:D-threo-aldose 1-dehydrogenase